MVVLILKEIVIILLIIYINKTIIKNALFFNSLDYHIILF
jgi:hypothetical protein